MRRIVIALAMVGSALLGSVATASALAGPTTEAAWRTGLTDCAIVAQADALGVSSHKIPTTAARCRRLRVIVGAERFR